MTPDTTPGDAHHARTVTIGRPGELTLAVPAVGVLVCGKTIRGSVASSMYGEPRSTLDLDLMVDADEAQDFYVDATAAIRNAQSHIAD